MRVCFAGVAAAAAALASIVAPLTPGGRLGRADDQDDRRCASDSTGTPGVYKLAAHMTVTGGARGELELLATADFVTLTDSGTIVGTVCGLG